MVPLGQTSSPFTVSLWPVNSSVRTPVTVTAGDGGAGGTFAPASVTLTTTAPSASLSYTAARLGTVVVAVDNNAGLSNPAQRSLSVVTLPAWAANARSGTWTEVPMAATLASIDPTKSPVYNPNYPSPPEWAGNSGHSSIVIAWCGAAYDEATDSMWLGVGGGHRDYAGNEVYRCGFFDAAPAWTMVRPPSGAVGNRLNTNDGRESTGLYADGRPRAVHTYNKWVYVPGVGPVLGMHGNTSWSAAAGRTWSVFIDPSNGEAAYSAVHGVAGIATASGCCYDPSRHAIWMAPSNTSTIYRYNIPTSGNPNGGSAASAVGSAQSRYYSSLTYLPGHDCLLVGSSDEDGAAGSWRVFDCSSGSSYSPAFNGSAPMGGGNGKTQPRWVPALGAVCAWHNASNTTQITRLTPGANPRTDPWTVSALPVSGSNSTTPTARVSQGTYGRFAYSPRLGGFLLFNSTSGSTYFYKL